MDGSILTAVVQPPWPALDGLRALAVAVVVGNHFSRLLPGGFVGVDVFFVLSGFLITKLLLTERASRGSVDFKRFFQRRALRLLPALTLAVLLATFLAAVATPAVYSKPTFGGLVWVVLYVADYARAFDPNPNSLGLLGQCWSLGVEEQFYLIWPFLLLGVIVRWGRQMGYAILAAAACVDCVWQWYLAEHGSLDHAYYALDSHCMGLLVGAALAIAITGTSRIPRWVSALASLVGLTVVVLCTVGARRSAGEMTMATTLSTLGSAAVIAAVVTQPQQWLCRLLAARPLRWVGRRSYGIYLYHYPLLLAFSPAQGFPDARGKAIALVLTIAIAAASYRLLELPFLNRRRGSLNPSPRGHLV